MDRKEYLTTGEVVSLMNVTKNTLFHYDKIGLFSPEIKKDNLYRYYSVRQLEILDVILWLRELDMPLEDIRTFLEKRNPEKLLEFFDQEEQVVQKQLDRLKDRLGWIRERRAVLLETLGLDLDGVYIRRRPRQYYVMNEVESDDPRAFVKGLTGLIGAYEKFNESIRYAIGYMQYRRELACGEYTNYHNVILLTSGKPRGLKAHILEEGEYLTAYHKGSWKGIREAYERLFAYAEKKGLELAGQFVERDVLDQLSAEKEEDFVTEIAVRITGRRKKIRAVVFDLDGTLLDSSKHVPEAAVRALGKLKEQGICVAAATGRPRCALPPELTAMEEIQYFITSNGAVTYGAHARELLRQTSIPGPLREQIFAACQAEDVTFEIFTEGEAYMEKCVLEEPAVWGVGERSLRYLQETRRIAADIRGLALKSHQLEEIAVRTKSAQQTARIRELLGKLPGLYVTSSVGHLVETADAATDKCKALAQVLEKLGLTLEETAAFGDGDNDIELLEAAGVGIAMGNASPGCKNAADYVTGINDEGGIVYGLEHILGLAV